MTGRMAWAQNGHVRPAGATDSLASQTAASVGWPTAVRNTGRPKTTSSQDGHR